MLNCGKFSSRRTKKERRRYGDHLDLEDRRFLLQRRRKICANYFRLVLRAAFGFAAAFVVFFAAFFLRAIGMSV